MKGREKNLHKIKSGITFDARFDHGVVRFILHKRGLLSLPRKLLQKRVIADGDDCR
jgi:hypothetical protein